MKRTAKGSNICNKLIFIGSQVLIIYSNISRTPPPDSDRTEGSEA